MSDVVFVTPNWNGYVREEPVGTLLMATILRNHGIDPKILQFYSFGDVNDFPAFLNHALTQITALCPRIVSFYTRCDSYHVTLKIAQLVKASLPDTYIVFGGPQSDLSAADTLRQIPMWTTSAAVRVRLPLRRSSLPCSAVRPITPSKVLPTVKASRSSSIPDQN